MQFIQKSEKIKGTRRLTRHWEREKGLMLNTGKNLSLIDVPSTNPPVSLSIFFFMIGVLLESHSQSIGPENKGVHLMLLMAN